MKEFWVLPKGVNEYDLGVVDDLDQLTEGAKLKAIHVISADYVEKIEADLKLAIEALESCSMPYENDIEFALAPDTYIDLIERQRYARECLEKITGHK